MFVGHLCGTLLVITYRHVVLCLQDTCVAHSWLPRTVMLSCVCRTLVWHTLGYHIPSCCLVFAGHLCGTLLVITYHHVVLCLQDICVAHSWLSRTVMLSCVCRTFVWHTLGYHVPSCCLVFAGHLCGTLLVIMYRHVVLCLQDICVAHSWLSRTVMLSCVCRTFVWHTLGYHVPSCCLVFAGHLSGILLVVTYRHVVLCLQDPGVIHSWLSHTVMLSCVCRTFVWYSLGYHVPSCCLVFAGHLCGTLLVIMYRYVVLCL